MQYWKPGAIFEVSCPKCSAVVEFFKDDTARKCGACGHRFVNPQMDFGCAAYCPYAEQCLGTLPEGLAAQKEDLLKDRVAVEMKRHFKTDFRRIGRAGRLARHAEQIGRALKGNPAVILSAAYLAEVGSPGVESGAGPADGASVARDILTRLGAREELIEEVCDIVARHRRPGPEESANFKAVVDASRLEDLDELLKSNPLDAESLDERIRESFLTDAGRETARQTLLKTR
jgi:hypothetical protein